MKKIEKKTKKGQSVIEYGLIFSLVAVACCTLVTKMDLKKIKNYVFMRPADSADATKIKIEAMTR